MPKEEPQLTIGQISSRTGISVSAIRFYETRGFVKPTRTEGGQRLYRRSDIRRLSFVTIAQQLGFQLDEIAEQLQTLPATTAPTRKDWTRVRKAFRQKLQDRIEVMTRLRDRIDSCIGCGCLSLRQCKTLNPEDCAHRLGEGPRYLLGERPNA